NHVSVRCTSENRNFSERIIFSLLIKKLCRCGHGGFYCIVAFFPDEQVHRTETFVEKNPPISQGAAHRNLFS
ncbi:MAG: hypothetical protein KDC85_17630, partial [Saprospiraceae bacterium]|nr:hypothetical protein [Saprospiraceae bacterium]